MRYFFDTRDDGHVTKDDAGTDFADLHAVKAMAAESLIELANEVLHRSSDWCLGLDVRDDRGQPILTTELTFRAVIREATA